jgi:hypothetical protein
MSVIDSFEHEQIGFVRCPMRHTLYRDGRVFDRLPVYRLLENVWDESSLSGRAGDVVIGGGFGEASALSFSIPALFAPGGNPGDVVRSHWSADDAFIFGTGFEQLGWDPRQERMFDWLASHLAAFLSRAYPDRYPSYTGTRPGLQNGSIFMLEESVGEK